MLYRHLASKLALGLLLVAATTPGWSRNWETGLSDGSRISVDPTTNKATYFGEDGSAAPLWDGVHQLDDGSTVIVRDGVMVPNEPVLGLRDAPLRDEKIVEQGIALCEKLVRKTCGLGDECIAAAACVHARSLLDYAHEEQEERSKPGFAARFVEVPGQCGEAMRNETLFAPCNKAQQGGAPTPCAELVARVCGAQGQCAQEVGCLAVRELLDREYDERLQSGDPDFVAPTSEQCAQALGEPGVFNECTL